MLNFSELCETLKEDTAWQQTPMPLSLYDYERMVVKGIRRLYVDTGRATEYDDALVNPVYNELTGEKEILANTNFPLDEILYILICSKIEFFKKVQTDVNNMPGYSTNAITITNADKPYAQLKDTIDKLENDRRELYYRMVRYTMGE